MGGPIAINNALQQIQLTKTEQHGASVNTPQPEQPSQPSTETPLQQTTQQTPTSETVANITQGTQLVGSWIVTFFLLVIGVGVLYQLLEQAFRYGYAFLNSHRLIFLKVILPRGDGKSDREQEKELAKDMKEKI
jgi:hypothetical protein